MLENTDRISIQVGLSGYSFKIEGTEGMRRSGWMSSERIFTTPELQARYDQVEISVFTPKCALVPSQFYSSEGARAALEDVADLKEGDQVDAVEVIDYDAVLLYSNSIGETLSKVMAETVLRTDGSKVGSLPEMYFILKSLSTLSDYNRIVASYMDGYLYLAIAQGKSLLLCNSYEAPDFTTAQYFIFMAMKKLQLNMEMSTICFRTPLNEEEEISLYRYFKNVEQI